MIDQSAANALSNTVSKVTPSVDAVKKGASGLENTLKSTMIPDHIDNWALAKPATLPISPGTTQDFRVRLSALHPQDVYAKGIMAILNETGGMLFPYTPTIGFTQQVNYMDVQLVHSNTDYPAYTRTPSVTISINGKFTVQNQAEGRYALACLHFLRTASKCYFGKQDAANDARAGLPPPVLVLSGYGNYMFGTGGNNASGSQGLRVVLKSHNWSFDESADGILIALDGGSARLPALFTVACELMVVQTPSRMREQFSFDLFASGKLMEGNSVGWI